MSGISKFFIDRPIFAGVISVLIVMVGALALKTLPIAQYPDITPPTVQVTCTYAGANAQVVSDTVASPIEQQVVGVEKMLYMTSQSTDDGVYTLTVTFELGVNLDMAQVLVQNRVNLALPTLPDVVKQTGVSVKKKSPSILLVVNLVSPDQSKDQLYLSNYATIFLKDKLAQIKGVGDVSFFGQQDYSMRIWLDPERVASRGLTATDIINVVREQNVQVAAGSLARPPVPTGQPFQYTISTLGRLNSVEQFGNIIVSYGNEGEVIYLKDIVSKVSIDPNGQETGGIQLGAKNQDTSCALNGLPSVGMPIYQLPGSNALDTADRIKHLLKDMKDNNTFPPGVDYTIAYDTTPFIDESIHEVFKALRDAIILVGIVVLIFLQSWRATLIPLIAVPVAIVGTFALMAGFGFSLNNLSLMGLVLAIGIVVDDAIVVVEAVEHNIEHGLSPRDASRKAMDEVAGPIIAISAVLMAVFVPCAFISGITGQFFRQFAVTIAVSTFFSMVNSLTLSPALCKLLLKPKEHQRDPLTKVLNLGLGWFFKLFNKFFDVTIRGYGGVLSGFIRVCVVVMLVYGGLLFLTYYGFTKVPIGFIPMQDKGYFVVNVQLPDAASLERTQAVMAEIEKLCRGDKNDPKNYPGIPGVAYTISIPGQSIIQNANSSNFGSMFVILDDFHHRHSAEKTSAAIETILRRETFRRIQEANVSVFGAPPVDGLGNAGGFKVMIMDEANQGYRALQSATDNLVQQGNQQPGMVGLFNAFRANTPQQFVDVDRVKCKTMKVPLSDVFQTLQVYLGSFYVNDINVFNRTWQVNLQADPHFRITPDDVKQLKIRNQEGTMLPLSSVTQMNSVGGPALITRYNGVTAATVNGGSLPSVSTGQVIKTIDGLAKRELPQGTTSSWTELMYMQILAGNTAVIVFAISVVLVFLLLAAQYESLRLPLAVILVMPMCLLASVIGVAMAGMDINIFVQIGFVVLVGLAGKNAILIVEVARERRNAGAHPRDAAIEASKLRLRPILMTSFAFILGVVPLAVASGAGAEMRRTLGIAVFSGMLGVTIFGLFLTPIFYYVLERLGGGTSAPVNVTPATEH